MEKFNTKKIVSIILCVIGLIASIKLTQIYYNVNFTTNAAPSFCSINSTIDCDGVAATEYSQFLGVPMSIWGILMYSFMLLLFYVPKLKQFKLFKFLEVFKNPDSYISLIAIFYMLGSLVMAWISHFIIHKICILCYVTYIINFILLFTTRNLLPVKSVFLDLFEDIKFSVCDFIDAVKQPKYLISFIVVCALGLSSLYYTATSNKFAPQVPKIKDYKAIMEYKVNHYKISGNVLGDPNGKIVINEYTDYECPFCSIANSMFHKLAHEVNGVMIVHHNYPLDRECNPYLKIDIHQHSCMMSRYALAAKNQGKFWDMSSALFENQQNITEARVIELARELGLNIDKLRKDAESDKVKKQLQEDIADAHKRKVLATPTFMIGLEKQEGIMKYADLKAKVIKMGATPKSATK